MEMKEITLNEILYAREQRAKKQKDILNRFKCPVISFTMNIAGPYKVSPLIERSFFEGIRFIKEKLPPESILYENTEVKPTGCEAFFSVNKKAKDLKKMTSLIEESVTLGRLFDMDVIDTNFIKLERENPRLCLICKRKGKVCSAGRLHSVEELFKETKRIMENYFFDIDKETLSSLAVKSLIYEVHTTPKPGLVDLNNNGSHRDMNVQTFEKSALSLKPYFEECFKTGKETANLPYDDVFPLLKQAGITAEKNMYSVTNGVNTHKGAIYSLGLICAAFGRLWSADFPFKPTEDICSEASGIAKNKVLQDFTKMNETTAGEKLYLKYGIKGIRGEVLSGFDSVLKISLPCYKNLKSQNYNLNDAGAITLLHLIANISDTNLYKRGGIEGAEYAKNITKKLLEHSPQPKTEEIELLDKAFTEKNLSPGGSADLLALTYFLYETELKNKEITNNNTHSHTD